MRNSCKWKERSTGRFGMIETLPIFAKEVAFMNCRSIEYVWLPSGPKIRHGLIYWHSNCIIHNSELGIVPVLRRGLQHGGLLRTGGPTIRDARHQALPRTNRSSGMTQGNAGFSRRHTQPRTTEAHSPTFKPPARILFGLADQEHSLLCCNCFPCQGLEESPRQA